MTAVHDVARTTRPATAAAVTLGVGLGGFFDGIVLHQILQLHNMMSGWIPVEDLVSAKVNMTWDGLFHLFVWLVTVAGVAQLWAAARRPDAAFPRRNLIGGFLIGWGLFNLIEGVIDHHLLEVHHVYERLGQSAWDWAFLAWGAGMLGIGVVTVRGSRRR